MLFAPSLRTDLRDKKIQLEHQKQYSQICLKNKVLTTSAFDVYEIHEPLATDNLSSQELNQPEMIIKSNPELADNIWENF